MTYYAIRRKADGKLLPRSNNGHHTRTLFEDYGPPRLFVTKQGAMVSLSAWCKGIWATGTEWESTNEYGDGYYIQTTPAPMGKHERNRDDYEVIAVSIVEEDLA